MLELLYYLYGRSILTYEYIQRSSGPWPDRSAMWTPGNILQLWGPGIGLRRSL